MISTLIIIATYALIVWATVFTIGALLSLYLVFEEFKRRNK